MIAKVTYGNRYIVGEVNPGLCSYSDLVLGESFSALNNRISDSDDMLCFIVDGDMFGCTLEELI